MDHIGTDVHKRKSLLDDLTSFGEVIEQRIRAEPERFNRLEKVDEWQDGGGRGKRLASRLTWWHSIGVREPVVGLSSRRRLTLSDDFE